ncbi:MAG: Gfo/Idh/MocA family oxidoreductase [Treponema sp.]|jgi:predicted dehydrogenase|nr:Gfo/Idh/MocA family oxidoreductase [Treponema sp.]
MLGTAIFGSGAIGAVHAGAYLRHKTRCEVRAVCDIFPEKARALIEKKELANAAAYKEMDEVLARKDIDVVSVCLPPGAHAEAAIKALKAGKHVLCEKPMAVSLEECDAMIQAAEESGKLLTVMANLRFETSFRRVKRLLDEGIAGRVLHATVNSLWWRGANYYDLWWRGTWKSEAGGCLINHAVHHLDVLLWMLGRPDRVTSVIANTAHDNSECEDLAVAILEYPGMLAQVTASLLSHDEEQEMIFQAEKARLSIPWKTAASKALPNGFPGENTEVKTMVQSRYDSLPSLVFEAHAGQIENLLKAVNGEEELFVTGRDGRAALELIMAIYKSSVERKSVSLPLETSDPFYRQETMLGAVPRFNEKKRSVDNFAAADITLGRNYGK